MDDQRVRLAIDTGGTFNDVIMMRGEEIEITKVPSTPNNYAEGILTGIGQLLPDMKEISVFLHGTTVATNAIVQKVGADCGLICTKGFRDLLEIRRGNRGGEGILRVDWDPPPPLIRRSNRVGVTERVGHLGEILTPLDEREAREIVKTMRARKLDAIVVSLLNSYLNPAHERRLKEIVQEEYPGVFVCTSSDLVPVMREFERTTTAVANAYVGPLMARYLASLEEGCAKRSFVGGLLLMQSHGGVMSSDFAKVSPVRTAMSGPAAGVIAARAIGLAAGVSNIMSFDMGGTSTDVSLIPGGEISMTEESSVEFGVPVLFPSVAIESVGAGGGTLGWVDEFGNLKSGPKSAGADPGPSCYGRGGTNATTTDAHLFLGRLDPTSFLGGKMPLHRDLAEAALDRLAKKFGSPTLETAWGLLRITDSNMEKAIRHVSIERGFDPREFSLIAFGGAGPLHCLSIAKEMSIGEVIVPPMPGLTSALGLLYADIKHDYTRTYNKSQDRVEVNDLEALFQDAEGVLRTNLAREGYGPGSVTIRRRLHMRYLGGFEPYAVQVPIGNGTITAESFSMAVDLFNRMHEKEFMYALKDHPIVVEIIGVEGIATTAKPAFKKEELGPADPSGALVGTRDVYFEGGFQKSKVYDRRKLRPGSEVPGPAVIEQMDSTTVIPPELVAKVDGLKNLRVRVGKQEGGS